MEKTISSGLIFQDRELKATKRLQILDVSEVHSRFNLRRSKLKVQADQRHQLWSWSGIIWLKPAKSLYQTGQTNYNAIDKSGLESDVDIQFINKYLLIV